MLPLFKGGSHPLERIQVAKERQVLLVEAPPDRLSIWQRGLIHSEFGVGAKRCILRERAK